MPPQPGAHTLRSKPLALASPFDAPRPGPDTRPGIVEPGTGGVVAVGLFGSYRCCSVDMGQAAAARCAGVACERVAERVAGLVAGEAEGVWWPALAVAVWGGVGVAVSGGAVHGSERDGCG